MSSLITDKRNCAIAPAVCGDFEECDYVTETCKPLAPPTCPLISMEAITPAIGARTGGTKVTISGSGFQGEMRVEIDGTPLENVVVEASSQLSGTLGASMASCGPSAVSLISSCFERITQERAFTYSLDPLLFDDLPQTLPSPSGTMVQQLLIDDVNADGDPDILGIEAGSVRNFLSDGVGSFTTSAPLALGSSLYQAAKGDITGDKAIDLVITDLVNPRLWLLQNSGKGVFSPQSIAMPEPLRGVVLTDLNSDGKSDALVVGKSGTLYLLSGTDTGLTAPDTVATGLPSSSQFAALADVTGDGLPELLVAGGSTQVVEVWHKSGAKSFARLSQKSVPGFASSVVAVDVSRDGKLDLVVALSDQKNLALLPGQGNGDFGNAQTVPSGTEPRWLHAIDTNCDGIPDIVASSATENKLGLLWGTERGMLAAPRIVDLSAQLSGVAQSLAVADVNFDGLADLVVGSTQTPAYLLIANISP